MRCVSPFALAAILGAGATLIWTFVLIVGVVSFDLWTGKYPRREELYVTARGEALLMTTQVTDTHEQNIQTGIDGKRRSSISNSILTYRTLDGEPIEAPLVRAYAYGDLSTGDHRKAPHPFDRFTVMGYRIAGPPLTYWYLVRQPTGRAYLVSFDPATRRPLRYVGKGGFREILPPVGEQFLLPEIFPDRTSEGTEPESYSDTKILVSSEGEVREIDWAAQTVRSLAVPQPVISLGEISRISLHEDRDIARRSVPALRFADRIGLLDPGIQLSRTLPIPALLLEREITVLETLEPDVVVYGELENGETLIAWIDESGAIRREATARLSNVSEFSDRLNLFAVALPGPLMLLVRPLVWGDVTAWSGMLLACSIAAAGAVVAYRRQRRYDGGSAAAWATFVFLLGPAGLLGYLLHRQWPARASCEHCGKLVPRNRSTCLACAAEFSPPAMKGVEVFA
jgi:hypothetical protein